MMWIICLLVFIVIRCLISVAWRRQHLRRKGTTRTLAVLGSGGHTAEMLTLMKGLDLQRYHPLSFIVAATDKISQANSEHSDVIKNYPKGLPRPQFYVIPRAREVGQSYISSIRTTLNALLHTLQIVFSLRPELVVCNGPGTCIPVCASALLFRILGIHNCQIIFVESFARVDSLSLSGKILYWIADRFLVQWPKLCEKWPRAEFIGTFV